PSVQRVEPDLPGRADDSGAVGPPDPPLPHFRDEWRELPLSRVDEIKEESEIGVKSKLPLLPRAAIFKTGVGQFCALRVGQSCALSSRKHAQAALAVFRPDGQLNDRAWAEAQVADALPALVGRAWVRVVNHLRTPESFTFLDRMHDALALIPVRQELRDALVRLWWLRRQRPGKSVVGSV